MTYQTNAFLITNSMMRSKKVLVTPLTVILKLRLETADIKT